MIKGVSTIQVALQYILGFFPSIISISVENLWNPGIKCDHIQSWDKVWNFEERRNKIEYDY